MKTTDFLDRVVPLQPGNFIALTCNRNPGGDFDGLVRMFDTPASAAGFAKWATEKRGWEVFHSQGAFLTALASDDGRGGTKYTGKKDASNIARSRALYLDLDVHRPGDKKQPGINCYPDRRAAVTWLAGFCAAIGMPKPSITVDSGYGFHPYWLLEIPLAPPDWNVLANGLVTAMKANGYIGDAGITTDVARILRLPGSLNRKDKAQDKLVEVRSVGPSIANADMQAILQPWIAMAQQGASQQHYQQGAATGTAGPSPLGSGGPSAAFAAAGAAGPRMTQAAQTGVGSFHHTHIYKMAHIATACGQVGESLRTGGLGDSYLLWRDLFTLAAFTTDGASFIHPLSDKDPRYTQAGADAQWQKTLNDKATKPNLGPTLCQSLAKHRSGICQACPHFNKIKSPIVLGRDHSDLPSGYYRGAGRIEMDAYDDNGNPTRVPVLFGDLSGFTVDSGTNGFAITFHYRRNHIDRVVRFDEHELAALDRSRLTSFFVKQHMSVDDSTSKRTKGLIMAWRDAIVAREQLRGAATPAFGWVETGGKIVGFAHAGTLYEDAGGATPTASGDPKILGRYMPLGDLAPWRAACDFVTKDRPDLTALVAASFGSPLMRFTGQSGVIVSCISRRSGIGKSTAIQVGQAVWGDPIQAVNSLNDTSNSVLNKIGETRALPAYWDELRGGGDNKRFVELAFQLTQGREKARMGPDIKLRDTGAWQTMLIAAANEPIMEHIVAEVQGTEAGALRLFEFVVEPPVIQTTPGAAAVIGALRTNYGRAGTLYATWLSQNHASLAASMPKLLDGLNRQLVARNEERFYVAAIACILQGAALANRLNLASFDIKALRDFLFEHFHKLRTMRERDIVAGTAGFDIETIFSEFMSDTTDRRLVTNIFGTGRTYVRPLSTPANGRGADVHVSVDEDTIRVKRSAFVRWMRERRLSSQAILDQMELQWGAAVHRKAIGSCTPYSTGQTWVVDVPATANNLEAFTIVQGTDKPN